MRQAISKQLMRNQLVYVAWYTYIVNIFLLTYHFYLFA